MDIRICLLLAAEAGLALVLLWSAGVLRKPAHVLCAALLLAAAFVLRGLCLNYETDDYTQFLTVWVNFFRTHGELAALRESVGNYNVPYLTFLALISGSSLPDLYLIKLFSIFFDVVLAWSVMQLVGLFRREAVWKLAAFFLVLFWPTVMLNSALWGQCDSVYAALAVLSVYLVLAGHPVLGVVSIIVRLQTAGRVRHAGVPALLAHAARQAAARAGLPRYVRGHGAAGRHRRTRTVGCADHPVSADGQHRHRAQL